MTKQKEYYDSSNEKHVADAKRREHNKTNSEINNLRAIMRTKEGRGFVWAMLGKCGVYRSVFDTDPVTMAFNEGRRDFGLSLLGQLVEHCLPEFQTMEKEQRGMKDD